MDTLPRDNTKNYILIKGARVHNLKNIDLAIPRRKLVVMTGVSGSGKSSLAFDTLYAEGQRRYVESLSSYARQFLNRMEKPDVDYIKGLSPAIAIEQKVTTTTTRSTVGTLTEIYDFLRLLYGKIGLTYSPVSGNKVEKHQVSDVVDYISNLEEGLRIQILAPIHKTKDSWAEYHFEGYLQQGFVRFVVDGDVVRIDDEHPGHWVAVFNQAKSIEILIDRTIASKDEDALHRIADSVQLAFEQSEGFCIVEIPGGEKRVFSTRFECDGILFEEPVPQFFNFNSPYGACPKCEGFGTILGYDEDLIIPDKSLSVYEGAVKPWKGEKLIWWKDQFIKQASKINFPIHTPIMDLNEEQLRLLWNGAGPCLGINDFFKEVEAESYKIQYRVLKSHYMGRTKCDVCGGSRLRPESRNVKIQNTSLPQLLDMTIGQLTEWFSALQLNESEVKIGSRILVEISNRLKFMLDVGLEYLSLNRFSNTLSGGETQRINLTRSLGSNLTDALYILDEPSVGLHPHDTSRLVNVLKYLRDLGNTVIVVEHEEEVIRAADYLVDIGPEAGIHGGKVVFAGTSEALKNASESLTTQYLNGVLEIPVPSHRRKPSDFIQVMGARQNNLKNIQANFPLKAITAVSGVSGSGKSTLVKEILYPALKLLLEGTGKKPGLHKSIEGATRLVNRIEMVDQNPIGRSSRSNPVTYIKAYDAIRELFASQSLAKVRGYQPKHFSFNVEGGRCEECQGEGEVLVEMQFLADIHLTCESCKGKRFKQEVLEVTFKEKSISDVLAMSVDEALAFFHDRKEIYSKLLPLSEVGLGYVQLGQSSSTLSGGEAQRVKLASFLHKGASKEYILFLFDEPTTGLHFHDINKLLKSFNALVEAGHTVIVVEHNIDVIKSADWVIDLGPKGGAEGGYLLYQGAPEGLLHCKESLTAPFLEGKLKETTIFHHHNNSYLGNIK